MSFSFMTKVSQMPKELQAIRPPASVGTLWAEDRSGPVVRLVGDLDALKMVDLEREGLGEYRAALVSAGILAAK